MRHLRILGYVLLALGLFMVLGSVAYAVVADIMRAYIPPTLTASGFVGIFMALFGGVMAWGNEGQS